jgi:hemerythrin-like domain-containing protein
LVAADLIDVTREDTRAWPPLKAVHNALAFVGKTQNALAPRGRLPRSQRRMKHCSSGGLNVTPERSEERMDLMKCTDLLIKDHKVILRSLEILDAMAAQVEAGKRIHEEDVESILHFLRLFADDHHQGKEESALFPAMLRTSNDSSNPLRHMFFEHDQERSLVTGLEDALRRDIGTDFVHHAGRLCALLRNHIYKEENILFPLVESTLSASQDEQVSAEFDRYDKAVQEEVWINLFKVLRALEWKYLGKAA